MKKLFFLLKICLMLSMINTHEYMLSKRKFQTPQLQFFMFTLPYLNTKLRCRICKLLFQTLCHISKTLRFKWKLLGFSESVWNRMVIAVNYPANLEFSFMDDQALMMRLDNYSLGYVTTVLFCVCCSDTVGLLHNEMLLAVWLHIKRDN